MDKLWGISWLEMCCATDAQMETGWNYENCSMAKVVEGAGITYHLTSFPL